MNGPTFWIALVAGEVTLVVFVLLFIYWIRNIGASRRDREAVNRLVKEVRKQKNEREAAVAAFLSDKMGLAEEALSNTTATILREELRLVQTFANIYSDRDSRSAAKFRLNVEQAVAPYYALKGAVMTDGASDSAEIEALRRENARLSEELTVTMDTMSRMLTEYSGMFANDEADGKLSIEESVSIASATTPIEETSVQVPSEPQNEEAQINEAQIDEAQTEEAQIEEAQIEQTEVIDPAPETVVEEPVLADQAEVDLKQGADDEAPHPVEHEVVEAPGEPVMDLEQEVPEAVAEEATEPQTGPVDGIAQAEGEAVVELQSEPEPVDEEPGPLANEVVDLDLESREDVVEPVDLGEVVELVPEESAEDESEDTPVDLMAEPVNDDEIDSLFEVGPLEDELGDLFDSDDIAVLDELPEEVGDDPPEKATIAI